MLLEHINYLIFAMDWKDMLAGIQSSLPEGEAIPKKADVKGNDDIGMTAKKPKLTISYEKKGRAGKPATIISGFNPDNNSELQQALELASHLKKQLGCGGSARGGEILLQGDRRQQLFPLLSKLGYRL